MQLLQGSWKSEYYVLFLYGFGMWEKQFKKCSTYFQRRLRQAGRRGRWEKSVCVKSRSITWGLQPVLLRSVTHTPSPRSPTACQWHGKVCLTKLPVTHFLSQPCTCTPLGDVMAGFPLGVTLLSTLPIWRNARMHACVFMCVHPSACLGQTSVNGPVVNVVLHGFSDDLFREATALQTYHTDSGGRGQWYMEHGFISKTGLLWLLFSPLLPSFLRYKYVLLLPPCVCVFNYL